MMPKDSSVSVVIASFSSVWHLEKCLQSIQSNAPKLEIIVSTCLAAEQVQHLKQQNVKFVFNPEEQNLASICLRETRVFRLRSSGVKAANSDIILLLEDHCEVDSKWLTAMLNTLQNEQCLVGGPIANGAKSGLFQWALYWSEYAAMMPPFPEQPVQYLSAVNSAYFKTALDNCRQVWRDGFYDNEVHDALIASGAKLCLAADGVVFTRLPFSFTQAFVHLFTGGQRYGAYRGGEHWSGQRLLRAAATLLVPAVLLLRVAKLVRLRQPKLFLTFVFSSPILYILLSAWGGGELVGTVRGKRAA